MHVAQSSIVILGVLGCLVASARADTHTVRYPNGQIRWQVEVVRAAPHGESTTWHANGVMASRGPYTAGVRHGVFRFWDERGTRLPDVVFRKGEKQAKLATGTPSIGRRLSAGASQQSTQLFRRQGALDKLDAAQRKRTSGQFITGLGVAGMFVGGYLMSKKSDADPCEDAHGYCIGLPDGKTIGGGGLIILGTIVSVVGISLWGSGAAMEAKARKSLRFSVSATSTRATGRLSYNF